MKDGDNDTSSSTVVAPTPNVDVASTLIAQPAVEAPEHPRIPVLGTNLMDVFARPRQFTSVSFDDTYTFDSFDVLATMRSTELLSRLASYRHTKFIPVMRFKITGDVTNTAAFMFGFSPLNDLSDTSLTDYTTSRTLSGFKHVLMDLHENNDVIMRGNWACSSEYMRTTHSTAKTLGHFFLHAADLLKGATTSPVARLTGWFWMEQVSLSLPVAEASGSSFEHGVPQATGVSAFVDTGLDYLFKQPTYENSILWTTTQLAGVNLFAVKPRNFNACRIKFLSDRLLNTAGVYVVQLFAIRTQYHRGTILISKATSSSNAFTQGHPRIEWDIAKNACISVRLTTEEVSRLSSDASTPWLQLSIQSPLLAPDSVAPSVRIFAYVSADQFAFDGIRAEEASAQCWSLESSEGITEFDQQNVLMPERKFNSLNALFNEDYLVYSRNPSDTSGPDMNVLSLSSPSFPRRSVYPSGLQATYINNVLSDFAKCFAFYDGTMTKTVSFQYVSRSSPLYDVAGSIVNWLSRMVKFVTIAPVLIDTAVYSSNADVVKNVTGNSYNSGKTVSLLTGATSTFVLHELPTLHNRNVLLDGNYSVAIGFPDQRILGDPSGISIPGLQTSQRFDGTFYGVVGLPTNA